MEGRGETWIEEGVRGCMQKDNQKIGTLLKNDETSRFATRNYSNIQLHRPVFTQASSLLPTSAKLLRPSIIGISHRSYLPV